MGLGCLLGLAMWLGLASLLVGNLPWLLFAVGAVIFMLLGLRSDRPLY